jgi:cytochrome c-type biogenesis protein CcmF
MENLLLPGASAFAAVCSLAPYWCPDTEKNSRRLAALWCGGALLVAFAALWLIWALVFSRFSYSYVAAHSSLDTPLMYKISALWAGQEGSFLLWAIVMALMGFLVLMMNGKGTNRSVGIFSAVGFCVYLLCALSRPLLKIADAPADGLGLNAALRDPWMISHPPLVFIAYGAMAVLFSLSATFSSGDEKPAGGGFCAGRASAGSFWARAS